MKKIRKDLNFMENNKEIIQKNIEQIKTENDKKVEIKKETEKESLRKALIFPMFVSFYNYN